MPTKHRLRGKPKLEVERKKHWRENIRTVKSSGGFVLRTKMYKRIAPHKGTSRPTQVKKSRSCAPTTSTASKKDLHAAIRGWVVDNAASQSMTWHRHRFDETLSSILKWKGCKENGTLQAKGQRDECLSNYDSKLDIKDAMYKLGLKYTLSSIFANVNSSVGALLETNGCTSEKGQVRMRANLHNDRTIVWLTAAKKWHARLGTRVCMRSKKCVLQRS